MQKRNFLFLNTTQIPFEMNLAILIILHMIVINSYYAEIR